MYGDLIIAIIAAISYSLTGYAKKKPRRRFSQEQFLSTCIIGFLVGLIQFYTKLEYNVVYGYLFSFGFIAVIESGVKLIWRKLNG
jgi:hypothetical protein